MSEKTLCCTQVIYSPLLGTGCLGLNYVTLSMNYKGSAAPKLKFGFGIKAQKVQESQFKGTVFLQLSLWALLSRIVNLGPGRTFSNSTSEWDACSAQLSNQDWDWHYKQPQNTFNSVSGNKRENASNFYFNISLWIGIYICSVAKENHRGFFHLLRSKIRAKSTRCFAGNLNLLLTQNLAQANRDAADLSEGPGRGISSGLQVFIGGGTGGTAHFLAACYPRGELTHGKADTSTALLVRPLYL